MDLSDLEIGGAADALEWHRKHGSEFHKHWTERRPAPLELTGDEITSFLDEHEVKVSWKSASVHFPRIVTLKSDSFPTTQGYTLREAVCLAAAKWKASNE